MAVNLNDIKICNMDLSHVDDVVLIENLSFKTPWTREAFISELTRNKCAVYRVAVKDERVVAYAGMWIMLDEAHITNVAVHPEYRGMGLGTMIMRDIIEYAGRNNVNAMTLEVRTGNISARKLYKKFNFIEVAVRKKYYQDTGEDAIIMWKYNI